MALEHGAVVLLGAGASDEAGVPMSFEMTRRIADGISAAGDRPREAAALNFVMATLVADQAARGSSSRELDVELVFAAVQLLAERRTLEVAPFVSAWQAAVDALDQADLQPHAFDRDMSDWLGGSLRDPPFPSHSPHRLITRLIDARTGRGATGATYTALADLMLAELRKQVATTSKSVSYLEPLVRRGNMHLGLTIASLNYDKAIELAAASCSVPVSTGIDTWRSGEPWDAPFQGIRLLKLHGSIDWVWSREGSGPGRLPHDVVVQSSEPSGRPAIVFGQRGKLRADGPFLSMLGEFERQLSRSGRLLVIGYSFRDDHVNEIVKRWMGEADDRKLLVVDPKWPDTFENLDQFRAQLDYYLTPRIGRGQPSFDARLEVHRMNCSEALRMLV